MPGGDKKGPQGDGPMTGRAAGKCTGHRSPGYVSAPGCRSGMERDGLRSHERCGRGRRMKWGSIPEKLSGRRRCGKHERREHTEDAAAGTEE
jgi:hypothetical protein